MLIKRYFKNCFHLIKYRVKYSFLNSYQKFSHRQWTHNNKFIVVLGNWTITFQNYVVILLINNI